jgi:hypothetical protein
MNFSLLAILSIIKKKYCFEINIFILIVYIWYKEHQFTRRLNDLEYILRKAVRFWNNQKKNIK